MTAGGVGRNIAENLARLGTPTHLVARSAATPRRPAGATAAAGVDVDAVRRVAGATGTYVAVLDDDGELRSPSPTWPPPPRSARATSTPRRSSARRLVVLDGNLSTATLAAPGTLATAAGVRVVLDPVSVPKAAALAPLLAGAGARSSRPTPRSSPPSAARAARSAPPGSRWCGSARAPPGSAAEQPDGEVTRLRRRPAEVVDVTGAGDAMLGAFCHALLGGADPADAAAYGHAAAALTVASRHTVRPDLTDALVRSLL